MLCDVVVAAEIEEDEEEAESAAQASIFWLPMLNYLIVDSKLIGHTPTGKVLPS